MSAIALSDRVTVDERRPGFGRLTAVELRKMVDTRAGFWLSIAVAAVTAVVAVVTMLTGTAGDHTLALTLRYSLQPAAFLLPVIGILLVTGEFSQRTAMTTLSLVPDRRRVLAAKLSAAIVVAVAALVVCLVVAVLATAIGGDAGSATWSLSAAIIPQALVFLVAGMVTGVAFGTALTLSAPAIVAYLLLPTIWNALARGIHGLSGVARWLDQSESLGAMDRHALSATGWARVVATLAVWMALPLAIGCWRLMRRDIA